MDQVFGHKITLIIKISKILLQEINALLPLLIRLEHYALIAIKLKYLTQHP